VGRRNEVGFGDGGDGDAGAGIVVYIVLFFDRNELWNEK
jgi:hypothetical protein